MFSAIATADIIDLRELSSGENAEIFIGFDDVPELLGSRVNGRVIELEFGGQLLNARRIEPAAERWILAVETVPSEFGQMVRIELPNGADGLDVVPTESGYRLSWTTIVADGDWTELPETPSHSASDMPNSHMISPDVNSQSAISAPQNGLPVELVAAEPVITTAQSDPCLHAAAAVESDPWDIDALTRHAECLLDDGQAEEATVLLERVIAFEPGRFDAVIALAEAHAARGDVDAARALYEQAANVAATDGQAVAARARARELAN